MKKTLGDIAGMLGQPLPAGADGNTKVRGVSTDSRTIRSQELFVPLKGERFNGHAYVEESFKRGAVASLWQIGEPSPPASVPLFFVEDTLKALQKLAAAYRRECKARVVAVTGSNGKTTTKDLIGSILSTTYKVLKTEGNYNNHIGLPLTLLQLEEDTEMAVVEMGMSARGEIALLSELARPEAAVITNIGESHLMQLGSRKEIARAKLEILKGLQPGGFFVYPGDEPLLRELMDDRVFREQMGFSKPAGMKLFRFGETDDNEMYPVSIMLDGFQTHFHLNRPEDTTFTVPLPGRHNVLNAAAAIAVCKYMGVAEKDIVRGLEQARIARMRFEWLRGLNGATIINDAYNASPSSVRAALDLIEDLKGYGRKIVILGDILELGEEEVKFHREIGRYLDPDTVDYVLTFGLLAENIAEEAKKRFPEGRVHPFSDKMQLARWAAGMMQANDLLLVKGSRGMKLEEVVEQLKEPD